MFKICLALIAVLAATSLVAGQQPSSAPSGSCSQYDTCSSCIAASEQCGWCSSPLVYDHKSNPSGFKCGGYDKQNPALNNFTCPGVFSTDKCLRGYKCDEKNYTCILTAPGSGTTLDKCKSNCSTVGKQYTCDNQTHTCKQALPGHGTSFEVCEKSCVAPTTTNPTHTQHTHTKSNHTHTQSNHSHAPHTTHPTTTMTPLYTCNATDATCVPAKPGEGESKIVCEAQCKHSNHTPTNLLGLWRGFSISNEAFSDDEYDFDFKSDSVQFTHKPGTILSGTAQFIGDTFTADLGSEKLACLYKQQLTQPTTFEMMFACSSNGAAPASFEDAMSASKSGSDRVLLLQRCVDSSICVFKLNAGPKSVAARKSSFLHSLVEKKAEELPVPTQPKMQPCEQYGASCLLCLSHPGCGWCGTNVTYTNSDGSTFKGSQCSAFQHQNGALPWRCPSDYSTDNCKPGFKCEASTQKCVPTQPGDGIPSMRACEAGCKAKPGPPSQLVGKWRGININQNYFPGVLTVDMTSGNFSETLPGGKKLSGKMSHYAAYIFIEIEGEGKIGCLWSTQSNAQVEYATFACGMPGGALPKGFDSSMNPKEGTESVLAKCISHDCTW